MKKTIFALFIKGNFTIFKEMSELYNKGPEISGPLYIFNHTGELLSTVNCDNIVYQIYGFIGLFDFCSMFWIFIYQTGINQLI